MADKLYALDAHTGAQLWNVSSPYGRILHSAAIAYRIVYLISGNRVDALNATTGSPIWSYTYNETGDWFELNVMVANKIVYAGFGREALPGEPRYTLMTLNAFSGSPVWQYTTDMGGALNPIIANGRLYAGSCWGNKTYCFVPSHISDGFDYPVGAPDGEGYYDAQDFGVWNDDYGGYHLGEDWNGVGGGDSDFGDPVYAVSNGKVVYAEDAGPGWGNVIIIDHTLPDGTKVQSMYAHLRYGSFLVDEGDTVTRGTKIAEIGKGYNDNEYAAHLHFEIRLSNCPNWGTPGPGYSLALTGWTDPSNFIDTHRQMHSVSVDGTVFNIGMWSNSSISNLELDPATKTLSFNVEGSAGTGGFCNVTIPKELLRCDNPEDWTVMIDTTSVSPDVTEDEDYTYVCFTYTHSQKTIYIKGNYVIPEFPSFLILPLIMIATLLAIIAYRKRRHELTKVSEVS